MIKITRKVNTRFGIIKIELGKHWEITTTRELQDSLVGVFKDEKFAHRKFVEYLKDGEIIPKWYGFAYSDFDTDTKVFMPIPLNLIVAGWRWFRFTVIFPVFKTNLPRNLEHRWIWQRAYKAGLVDGYVKLKSNLNDIDNA